MNRTENIELPKSCDAVVIGSGMGGLLSALELQRHGLSVCILEKRSIPGGYAHSFRRGDYVFDATLHHFGNLEGGIAYDMLGTLGVLQKLKYERRASAFTSRFPESTISLPESNGSPLDQLSLMFPEEAMNLRCLFKLSEDLKKAVTDPVLNNSYDSSNSSFLLAEYSSSSFYQLLKNHIKNEDLIAILSQAWMYVGLPPQKSNISFSNCVFTSLFIDKCCHIFGEGTAIANALVEPFIEKGGQLFCNSEVKEILVAQGNVKGVITKSNTKVNAEIVIGNCDPFQLFFNLVKDEHISKIYQHRIIHMKPSASAYAMYIGLDCTAESLGIPEGTYFHNHDYDIGKAYRHAVEGNYKKTDWCLTNYPKTNPSTFPEGGGILSFAEIAMPEDWFELSNTEYNKKKEKVKDTLLNKYDKVFPGLKKHAKVIVFGTPRTMKRYSGNHQGAIYGFEQSIEQSGNKRLANKTPIKGLYLAGAWTQAGGGYEGSMMTGIKTAHEILNYKKIVWKSLKYNPIEQTDESDAENMFSLDQVIFPDDVDHTGTLKGSSLLRFMDRGRVNLIYQGAAKKEHVDMLETCHVNVYSINSDIFKHPSVGELITIKTRLRKATQYRAAYEQIMVNAIGSNIAKCITEVMFVHKQNGTLMEIPSFNENVDSVIMQLSTARLPKIEFKNMEHFKYRSYFHIFFEDTDAQAIVYNVAYVRFCAKTLYENRINLKKHLGVDVNNALERKITIRFLKAGVLFQGIEVLAGVRIIDGNSIGVDFRIKLNESKVLLADAYIEYIL